MKTLKILTLDLATDCGWAHSDGISGVWDLSIKRDESGGMRLLRLQSKLNEIEATVGVDLVFFEAPRNAKHAGTVMLQGEMQSVVKVWCDSQGIDYRGYSPKEIKKHATGNGNAGKPMMIEAAKKRWPRANIIDDNQADALCLLSLVLDELYAGGSKTAQLHKLTGK